MQINDTMLGYIEQALDERLDKEFPLKRQAKHREAIRAATIRTSEFWYSDLWRALELACADPRPQDKAIQEKLDQAVNACCDAYNYITGSRSKGDLLSTLNDTIEAAS